MLTVSVADPSYTASLNGGGQAGQARRPTRRVTAKVLTLHPAIVQ
jgi:hypothetical protein